MGVVLAEQSLGSGADAQPLLQLFAAAMGDPGHFGSKAFHMVLFLVQQGFGNENGHCHVLMAGLFDHAVKDLLNVFPDGLGIGAHDDAATHAGIVDQFGFFYDVGIPLGEVFIHGGDFPHHFFVVCHIISLLSLHKLTHIRKTRQYYISILEKWQGKATISPGIPAKGKRKGR